MCHHLKIANNKRKSSRGTTFEYTSKNKEKLFMLRIKKRDGNIEEFDITKIENAIEKAFMAEHKFYNHDIIEMLALRVTSDFNRKVVNDTIGIEDVQDSVEIVLIQAGYVDVARSYIIYRKQHQNLRDIK